jgi:hypothetical protein
MTTDTPQGQEEGGYAAEDAALASAGEPERLPEGGLAAEAGAEGPSPEELDARDERFGPRKPMGPGLGAVPETVPEDLSEPEEPRGGGKRKKGN